MHIADTPVTGTDRKVDRLLAHYGESHRNPTNEAIHMVAIPAIMFSIVGLLFALHPWVAYAFVAASLVYYATLRSPVFLGTMLIGTVLLLAVVHATGDLVLPVSGSSATRLKERSRPSSRTFNTCGWGRCSCCRAFSCASACAGRETFSQSQDQTPSQPKRERQWNSLCLSTPLEMGGNPRLSTRSNRVLICPPTKEFPQ
jgi:hypothetical protein